MGKPEELVRQKFIRHLCENYGYVLEQMRQEMRMISGSCSARADIVIRETPAKAAAGPGVSPVLVIECKAESVEINPRDYYQGESYTRSAGAEFFIATNNCFTLSSSSYPDGHGGIHYLDGLVDINGIFPPLRHRHHQSSIRLQRRQRPEGRRQRGNSRPKEASYINRCESRYGEPWRQRHDAMQKAMGTNILDLFEIGKGKKNRATEIVFVERCLNLLKPGGRMGIVLPDCNLNNPSLTWLRRWCEGEARILGVVSLPEETFSSSKAPEKASLVFLRRFTEADETAWEAAWTKAHADHDATFNAQRDPLR